jgi:hypothetical protein
MAEHFRGWWWWEGDMRIRAACLTAVFLFSGHMAASAGPVVDAATRAETLQAEGDFAGAIAALYEAIDLVWEEAPLSFGTVAVVESSEGYGVYAERDGAVFEPDERMMVYVEPLGFGYGGSGAESTIDFTADLAIKNASGQVLGENQDVFSLSSGPRMPNKREFSMTLSFGVPFLRPGDYAAVFTVHDPNSGKSGTFEVPFEIVLPGSAPN